MTTDNTDNTVEAVTTPASTVAAPTGGGAQRVAKNIVSTIITQIVSWVLAAAITYIVPRYAGTQGLGQMTFAGSLVGIAAVAISLGTSTVLVKEVARDRNRTGELLLAAVLLRLPLGLLVLGALVSIAYLMQFAPLVQTLILVGGINIIIQTLGEAVVVTLQGQERIVRSNLVTMIQKFADSVFVILLVLLKAPLWCLVASTGVTATMTLLMNLTAFPGLKSQLMEALQKKENWNGLVRSAQYLLVAGMPFLGWTIAKQLYGYTDPLVLKAVAGSPEIADITIAWYNGAFRLIGTTLFIPVAIASALTPTLSRLFKEDTRRFEQMARQFFAINLLIAAPIAVLLACGAKQIVSIYQADLARGSMPVLQIGAVAAAMYFMGISLGTIIVTSDRQQVMTRSSVVGAIIGIPLCILCSIVTRYLFGNAAIGAMLSDGLLEVVLVIMYVRSLSFRLFDRETVLWLGRCALATVPMILCLVLSAQWYAQIWMAIPAVVLYGLACILLGCIDKSWLRMMREMLQRRTSPPRTA